MRITKVYTRTGDKGKTRLAGGQSVWKDDARVECYGTVDELNAAVGMVRALALEDIKTPLRGGIEGELHWMQNKLFDIGGLLATASGQSFPNMPRIEAEDAVRLEKLIDGWQAELQPLKEFILPGGGRVASAVHMARTICRRAERCCVHLSRKDPVDPAILAYLNRLSDALFVLARWITYHQGEKELLWERTGNS